MFNEKSDVKEKSNSRTASVIFESTTKTKQDEAEHSHPLAVLEVNVCLQPHSTDQVFRFYAPENSFLRKAIRLPPYSLKDGEQQEYRKFVVRCSDPAMTAEVRNNGPADPQDILLRIAVGASPNVKPVMLGIFSDAFNAKPIQVWELWIHALQRYDVTCLEGETCRFSLVIRGTNSSRLVRCFTSHAKEMSVEPNVPFLLSANAVHELQFSLKPLSAGQRLMIVNVVDLQLHQLLRSWLVCLTVEQPAYSRICDLVLPVGPAGSTHNKKLSFTNPFGKTTTFLLK